MKQRMTKQALDRLRSELDDLTTRGREDIAKRIGAARDLGDLSENAEYHSAREEQGMMEARIRQLQSMIDNAEEHDEATAELVTLRPVGGGSDEVYLLAPSKHERSERALRTITFESPLGQALSTGESKVSYDAPGGTFSYEVVAREPWSGD